MSRTTEQTPKSTIRVPYILIFTIVILLIPLIAMQFSGSFNWTFLDFVAAAIILISAGLISDLLIRNIKSNKRRLLALIILAIIFVYLWAEMAVGVFTNFGS